MGHKGARHDSVLTQERLSQRLSDLFEERAEQVRERFIDAISAAVGRAQGEGAADIFRQLVSGAIQQANQALRQAAIQWWNQNSREVFRAAQNAADRMLEQVGATQRPVPNPRETVGRIYDALGKNLQEGVAELMGTTRAEVVRIASSAVTEPGVEPDIVERFRGVNFSTRGMRERAFRTVQGAYRYTTFKQAEASGVQRFQHVGPIGNNHPVSLRHLGKIRTAEEWEEIADRLTSAGERPPGSVFATGLHWGERGHFFPVTDELLEREGQDSLESEVRDRDTFELEQARQENLRRLRDMRQAIRQVPDGERRRDLRRRYEELRGTLLTKLSEPERVLVGGRVQAFRKQVGEALVEDAA